MKVKPEIILEKEDCKMIRALYDGALIVNSISNGVTRRNLNDNLENYLKSFAQQCFDKGIKYSSKNN